MANPWFRLHAEFASDPKVQMLSEADQRRFIMLLCLRCQSDRTEDFTDATVTFALRITVESWCITKEALRDRYLIDENNMPTNWDKRQYINDIKDPTNAERQRRWRERNAKQRYSNVTERLPDTDTDTDTETETDTDNNISLVNLPVPAERGECEKIARRKENSEAQAALLQCVGEGWNELAATLRLPQVSKLTDKRKSWVVARAKELVSDYDFENPIDGFSHLFEKIRSSKFLRGEANGFRCDFDFAFNQSSFTKIMEGRYENSQKASH